MRLYRDMVRVDHSMRITYAQNLLPQSIPAARPCLRLPDSLIAINRSSYTLIHLPGLRLLLHLLIPLPIIHSLYQRTNMTNPNLDSEKDGTRLASYSSLLHGPASLRPGHWDIR